MLRGGHQFSNGGLKKLEIGTFLGICSFQGLLGNNKDSPIFRKFWGQGYSYFNDENWAIFGLGTVQYFWEFRRSYTYS